MREGQVISDLSVLCMPFSLMSLAFYLRSKLILLAWSYRLQIYITEYKANGFIWNIALCLYISRYIYILSLSLGIIKDQARQTLNFDWIGQ